MRVSGKLSFRKPEIPGLFAGCLFILCAFAMIMPGQIMAISQIAGKKFDDITCYFGIINK